MKPKHISHTARCHRDVVARHGIDRTTCRWRLCKDPVGTLDAKKGAVSTAHQTRSACRCTVHGLVSHLEKQSLLRIYCSNLC